MGDTKGFLNYRRVSPSKEPAHLRVRHNNEFESPLSDGESKRQGARCMDCGVPFCHNGCPLGNHIPDWNHLVSQGNWRQALFEMQRTNNFPEFTGRICPAPCESACVLGINDAPVAIESIELAIAEQGFAQGWIKPRPPVRRSGFRVAVIGSGPAGLAAAQELNNRGHQVIVYERADRPGGLLMYGIPSFKLEKKHVLRRLDLLTAEGIEFRTNVTVGVDVALDTLRKEFDSVVLSCGATNPRDIDIPGRHLKGIAFADDFLKGHTKWIFGDKSEPRINAHGKNVIVIGGGDTGSDCVGTSNRHGASSITQFEILEKPPAIGMFPKAWERPQDTPWPLYTHMLRTSSSQEEGCERFWTLRTKEFVGDDSGSLKSLVTESLQWDPGPKGAASFRVVPGSEKRWPCDIALIAIGYRGPELKILEDSGIGLDNRGAVHTADDFMTSMTGVFAAGDMRRGQSLVVWAIHEGRQVAQRVHEYLSTAPALLVNTPSETERRAKL